ncbi:uncharacterized protein CCOS01_07469 [Colletotrichum costaricense]|uniref:Major facilitator superfamily transporter n=2 Tax=Colletotrichum acutatum species complex TaxID=2707335 RepID=A0AAJ0E1A8_9PEZI|nr:uncharacterized protein CCOS01_07469 [Colletotrichum costaricense]XP_060381842.1 uncharacterized protein CTAM01_07444 [Colletotrichum tamarilloi]KAK1498226.1 hypothetical protein CTAM01_07444 [Colletotrichum tamarilloi]KAK1527207.1 hypothetical protein CCOS01_07469 [Colletotrichum costaricense]
MGQLLFAIHLSHIFVNQITLIDALKTTSLNTPWLIGSYLVANGVSVLISGSLADLISPKHLTCAAFIWLTLWNLIAMSGLAVGTLCSAAMSMLGRVYNPGLRKNRVFSLMGAMIPLGFAIGFIQGASILSLACLVAAIWCIPSLPNESLSLKDFDYIGAAAAILGCGLLIFGLTQGSPAQWTPYTYTLVIIGVACLASFGLIESRVRRPLIDNRLWKTPGFFPLISSYFLGYGAYAGAWQFYAVRFLLTIQQKPPIIGHVIMMGSMLAFATGPAFFLPQQAGTLYWALSFPCFIVSTFGPDMSFAAVSVFITSNVPRSYQGAAGSLVITAQNLSTAVLAALGDTIGEKITGQPGGSLDLMALRSIWWLSLATALTGALICGFFVRIPRSEEKEHIS